METAGGEAASGSGRKPSLDVTTPSDTIRH